MNNREIDRLVAEKVMGWEPNLDDDGTVLSYDTEFGNLFFYDDNENDWSPSVNIQDAWKVVDEMRANREFRFELVTTESFSLNYKCRFRLDDVFVKVVSKSAPLAICLAALKAVGVEVQS
ncbi:hypothetical protein K7T73_12780 [Bacillus badius]|uniref:BC1872 family protein n=1 Tax=Bacillus badius TaxID=1455 RepID=UPI001CC00548|nr:hypothetical protein [Bacillus badius]UAT29475.1 hypothetical protein K7T73_12780 [Bacillus badius]